MNKLLKWAGIGCGGLVGLFVLSIGISLFLPDPPKSEPVASSSPAVNEAEATATAECKSTLGNLYSDVQLYMDKECIKPIATVIGGATTSNGDRGVRLRFPSGEIEVKERAAVTQQTYVKADDPAIAAKQWR